MLVPSHGGLAPPPTGNPGSAPDSGASADVPRGDYPCTITCHGDKS